MTLDKKTEKSLTLTLAIDRALKIFKLKKISKYLSLSICDNKCTVKNIYGITKIYQVKDNSLYRITAPQLKDLNNRMHFKLTDTKIRLIIILNKIKKLLLRLFF